MTERNQKGMKTFISERGFSLVELMIVVAIIGILSAIAVPNFQRFRAKAIQAEAKSNLGAYYSASKATFAEFGFYPGNFVAIGFQPEGQLNYRILAADNSAGITNSPSDAACVVTSDDCDGGAGTFRVWTEHSVRAANNPASGLEAAGTNNFVVLAAADLGLGAGSLDEWSMNQQRVLNNETDGIP